MKAQLVTMKVERNTIIKFNLAAAKMDKNQYEVVDIAANDLLSKIAKKEKAAEKRKSKLKYQRKKG